MRTAGRSFAAALVAIAAIACDAPSPSRSTDDVNSSALGVSHAAADAPNILVLMLDTVAARRIGAHGAGEEVTPRLDAFARTAHVFERAVSTSNWTLPSHASIFTGLYPTSHGATGSDGWLSDAFPTLAEVLSSAGYATYLFSANPYVSDKHGLDQGFETTEYTWEDPWQEKVRAFMDAREYEGNKRLSKFAAFKDAGAIIRDGFLEWEVQRSKDPRPFFAFLNFMEAHQPWYVTRDERGRFLAGSQLEHSFELNHSYGRRHAFGFGYGGYTEEDLAVVRGLYDASVHRLDAIVGELLAELERRGRFEDTVIVVVSDHGDETGEHGLLGHEYALYDTLLHVPLLIRHPALFPPGRTSGPVQSIDLYPTLLEVAGVKPPDGHRVESRSLLHYAAAEAQERAIVGEYLKPKQKPLNAVAKRHPEFVRERWLRPLRSIEVGGYKLIIREGDDPELYHVAEDADERFDIARRDPARVARLLARLDAWDAERAASGGLVPGTDRAPSPDALHRALLEALGYVEPLGDGTE